MCSGETNNLICGGAEMRDGVARPNHRRDMGMGMRIGGGNGDDDAGGRKPSLKGSNTGWV